MRSLLLALLLFPVLAHAQAVPTSRLAQANWRAAGVTPNGGIPARATVCRTILAATYKNGADDASGGIQKALDACPSGQTVLLGAGTFRVLSLISVPSNVTIRGAGAGVTILNKTNGAFKPVGEWPQSQPSPADNAAIFRVGNSNFPHFQNGTVKTLTANAVQGATSVTLNNVGGLKVGQYVEISEDQFYTGSWQTLPLSSGVANIWEVWSGDRIGFSRYRVAAAAYPVTITTSDAGTNRLSTSGAHNIPVGALVYITGHGGTFSPVEANGTYMVLDVPTSSTLTLRQYNSGSTAIDITAGGSGGTMHTGRAYTTFTAGPVAATGSALEWFNRGGGHLYNEVKQIAAIKGNTVTFTSPFTDTYRTSHSAELAVNDTAYVEHAGIEAMTLNNGADGAIKFLAAAKSWVKDVEIHEWAGHGIGIHQSHRIEITGCYIRHTAWPVPGGGGYAISFVDGSSELLVTNSITRDTNKNIVANSGGAGSVVSYNYFDDALIWYDLSWQEVSANASHFGGPHHVLFEGNRAVNFDSDFTHGSAYSHTAARNYLTGQRESYAGLTNGRTLGLGILQLNMSAVGNVLGYAGMTSPWVLASASFAAPTVPTVYKIGYDPGDWNQAAHAATVSSFIDGDNYNYFTPGIRTAAGGAVPNSYYLSAAPSFFGTCAWPWVDAGGDRKVQTLPAYARYVAKQPLDTVTNRCAASGGPMPLR